MKYLYLFISLLSFGVACNAIESTPQKSKKPEIIPPVIFTLKDSSVFHHNIVLEFIFHDSLFLGHPFLLNKSESQITIPAPTLIVQSNTLQIPYYIYPGEHIDVSRDSITNEIVLSANYNIQKTMHFF